jgi:hypothetical protein
MEGLQLYGTRLIFAGQRNVFIVPFALRLVKGSAVYASLDQPAVKLLPPGRIMAAASLDC